MNDEYSIDNPEGKQLAKILLATAYGYFADKVNRDNYESHMRKRSEQFDEEIDEQDDW